MGAPNRSGGRRRRNTSENGLSLLPRTVVVGGEGFDLDDEGSSENLVQAPEADPEWHPVAAKLYEGMRRSGQRVYYEPSDWALAYVLCEHLTRELNPKFVGMGKRHVGETDRGLPIMEDESVFETVPVGSFAAIMKAMEKLMVSEPDRRRARIEIERGAVFDDSPETDIVASRADLVTAARKELSSMDDDEDDEDGEGVA